MEQLKIEYENGIMVLLVDGFFPCTVQKAKIIFPLIGKWCSEEKKTELKKELTELRDGYAVLGQMYKEKPGRHWKAEYKRAEMMRRRMERNIEYLEKVSRQ